MRLECAPARVILMPDKGQSRLIPLRNDLEAARLALMEAIEGARAGGSTAEIEKRAKLYAHAIRRYRWEVVSDGVGAG